MNTYQFSFEKLEVWQLARRLSVHIYKITGLFPAEEKYNFVSQLRRAALSVAANIAEGSTRSSAKDKAYFTTLAYGSLMEVYNHLIIAADLNYLSEADLNLLKQHIQTLTIKLSNLKAHQLKEAGD